MDEQFAAIIEESISLELNVADLYLLFHDTFAEDAGFWWELSFEEKNHAALIRSAKESFEPLGKFPQDLIEKSLQSLKITNQNLESLVAKYKSSPPSREEALAAALRIENSAAELHYQEFMNKEAGSKIEKIFQRLNKDDKNHAQRIVAYMKQHGIDVDANLED